MNTWQFQVLISSVGWLHGLPAQLINYGGIIDIKRGRNSKKIRSISFAPLVKHVSHLQLWTVGVEEEKCSVSSIY